MKLLSWIISSLVSSLFFLKNDKPSKFEGLYADTLIPQRITFVLKYDPSLKIYSGAIMDRLTKQTYAVSIEYITNDSLIGTSYNFNGVNKKVIGYFTHENFLKLTVISGSLGVITDSYLIKKVSNKPKYDESKLNSNKNYLDKKLIGKWLRLDSLNNSSKSFYINYGIDGIFKNSMMNIDSDAKKLINEGKVKYKWTTKNNILTTYIEATFPLSFDLHRSIPYKIEGDTLFLFNSKMNSSKFIKNYDK